MLQKAKEASWNANFFDNPFRSNGLVCDWTRFHGVPLVNRSDMGAESAHNSREKPHLSLRSIIWLYVATVYASGYVRQQVQVWEMRRFAEDNKLARVRLSAQFLDKRGGF